MAKTTQNTRRDELVPALGVMGSIFDLNRKAASMLRIIMIMGGALCLSLMLNIGLIISEKPPVYFGLSQDMTLLPMHPLSEPMVDDSALKAWLGVAVTEIFNMDFVDWRNRVSNARQYFTSKAFEGYAQSLEREGHIATLEQYRSIMHGVPIGPPVIVASGLLKGVRTWDMEIPFMLSYQTSERQLSAQQFIIQARVQRVSTTEYPKGIAMTQMTISRDKKQGR